MRKKKREAVVLEKPEDYTRSQRTRQRVLPAFPSINAMIATVNKTTVIKTGKSLRPMTAINSHGRSMLTPETNPLRPETELLSLLKNRVLEVIANLKSQVHKTIGADMACDHLPKHAVTSGKDQTSS